MTRILQFLIVLAVALQCLQSNAQDPKKARKFVPGNKVIFEDDFNSDPVGSFPSKWRIASCNSVGVPDYDDKKYWKIRKEDSDNALAISTGFRRIEPLLGTRFYLPDSFAVEFDFTFYKPEVGCAELTFYPASNTDPCKFYCLHLDYVGDMSLAEDFRDFDHPTQIVSAKHTDFAPNSWHHFAIAYRHWAMEFYIDSEFIASVPDCGFTPYGLALSCVAPAGYKHFRITTAKEKYDFSKLISEKKMVTHAILFDVNKSVIKPESLAFIRDLADFLAKNPSVNLEVDGHTDSDGSPAANIALSQARADEVKRQMVAAGIHTDRLKAKGIGAAQPIKPNTSPENKAENRRVEFIKQ